MGPPASGTLRAGRVLTGLRDHTVLVSRGALHQRLAVLVAAAHVAVQGPGWGEEAGTPSARAADSLGPPLAHLSLGCPPPPEALLVPGTGTGPETCQAVRGDALVPWDGGR